MRLISAGSLVRAQPGPIFRSRRSAVGSQQTQPLDPSFQFFEMRARPIDFAAGAATPKILVINLGERLELLEYFRLLHAIEETVALQAAGVGRNRTSEVEPSDHFDGLLIRISRARAIAVTN